MSAPTNSQHRPPLLPSPNIGVHHRQPWHHGHQPHAGQRARSGRGAGETAHSRQHLRGGQHLQGGQQPCNRGGQKLTLDKLEVGEELTGRGGAQSGGQGRLERSHGGSGASHSATIAHVRGRVRGRGGN